VTARKVSKIVASREKREDGPVSLLSVVPPSAFEREHLERFVQKMVKKKGFVRKRSLEDVVLRGMMWMPYYRVRYEYRRSREDVVRRFGKTGRAETALNAIFCAAVKDEDDLLMLFRPNYLRHKTIEHLPQPDEIVGPTFQVDFDEVLNGLTKRLDRSNTELQKVASALSKSRIHTRRRSMIFPLIGESKRKEGELSGKVAELRATSNLVSICLNANEDVGAVRVTDHEVFYYPNLVVKLVHERDGSEKYLIINLVKSGMVRKRWGCDRGLMRLCNSDSACKKVIATTFASTCFAD
jgi:hypothetical protein